MFSKKKQIFGKERDNLETNEVSGKGMGICSKLMKCLTNAKSLDELIKYLAMDKIFWELIRYLAQGGIGSVLIDRPTNLPGLKHFQANFKVS